MPKVQPPPTNRASRVRRTLYSAKDSNTPVYCSVCNKQFPRQSDLNRHERIHSDDIEVRLPHKCPQCPKRFANKDAIRPHTQSRHSSSPQYKCDICEKPQNTKSGLYHHEKSHNKVKPTPRPKKDSAARTASSRQSKHKAHPESEICDTTVTDPSPALLSPELSTTTNDQPSYIVESISETQIYYGMPSSFDPVVEPSFPSHFSPSNYALGTTGCLQNEVFNVFCSPSYQAFAFSSLPYENNYNTNLLMDSSHLENLQINFSTPMVQTQAPVNAYSLDFSTGFVHNQAPTVADAFFDDDLTQFVYENFTPLLGEAAVPSQLMQSELDADLEPQPHIYSFEDQMSLSASTGELQSISSLSIAAPQELDASWIAWLAQGSDPSLVASLNSSFPFNGDVASLVHSHGTQVSEQTFTMGYSSLF